MKQKFVEDLHLSKQNKLRLSQINQIIEEYNLQGYRLTLRQLYYQLVSRDVIPNNDKEYAKLSTLLTKGRMGGVVDWDAIEDRIRVPKHTYFNHDIEDAISDAEKNYRLDRMEDQDNYIELWVEKDALSNVLQRKTSYYHVRLMVNRGYSSTTAIYDSYNRIRRQIENNKVANILYLGDHDPSGLDMVRDIQDRLVIMLKAHIDEDLISQYLRIHHIGLTSEQIQEHNPPPNPTKVQDPRADWYISLHGHTCWEVDALNPGVLHEIIDSKVKELIDEQRFEAKLKQEEIDKDILKQIPDVRQKYGDIQCLVKETKLPVKPTVKDYKKLIEQIKEFC